MATKKKKSATKATKKTAKKATTKTAKKATKKVAKKAAKKTAKKATKKVAKKPAKKVAKKAAKKTAKKAAKKTAKKAARKAATKVAKKTATKTARTAKKTSAADADFVALPAKRLPQEPVALPSKRLVATASHEAAVTLVPEDDVDDALDEAVGAAFDSVFVPVSTPPSAAAPFEPGDPAEDLAQACAALALEKKAEDVVVLRVAELTSYADFFVIAQAPSDRQVQAIARNVTEALKKHGKTPMSTDGLEQGNWVIVDYGSVVLHVFLTSARSYYDLDGFWVDAPRLAVDEARGQGALAAMA